MNIISPKSRSLPESIEETIQLLAKEDYLCDRQLATTLFLSLRLARPIFLEGEPGVGKTELAKSLAKALGTELFRIQCYEGLDVAQSAYEWNVAKQMVENILKEAKGDASKVPLAWYTGNIQGKMSDKALAANNGLTAEKYQAGWMNDFNKMGGKTDIAGPTGSYESKMASVQPDKTLPPKEAPVTAQSNDPTKSSDDLVAKLSEHMERQTRALSDINDNTKKSAQHAAA